MFSDKPDEAVVRFGRCQGDGVIDIGIVESLVANPVPATRLISVKKDKLKLKNWKQF